jgi:subtilase family serine protease
MKIKTIIMASLFLLASAYTCATQAGDPLTVDRSVADDNVSTTLPAPIADYPDLVVTKVEAPNLDGGDVMVTVKNQGTGRANACYLALTLPVGSTAVKTRTMAQAALNPGESVTIAFVIGGGLSQIKYCATTDRSNTVRESDERNNKNCGQFGGKP